MVRGWMMRCCRAFECCGLNTTIYSPSGETLQKCSCSEFPLPKMWKRDRSCAASKMYCILPELSPYGEHQNRELQLYRGTVPHPGCRPRFCREGDSASRHGVG